MISCKEQAEFGWLSLILAVVKVQILQNLCLKLLDKMMASESIKKYCCNLSTNQNIFDLTLIDFEIQKFCYLNKIVLQTWIKSIFFTKVFFH